MPTSDAMRITLVGMSGSGKSYWSGKLKKQNFKCFLCDDLIAERLFPDVPKRNSAIQILGEWMGYPFQPDYERRESVYLNAEIEVLAEILEYLRITPNSSTERVVIDSTGSVIYSGQSTLQKLRRFTTVVHLATPAEIQEDMLKIYLAQPRPVLWRGIFTKRLNETDEQAMARCYPILLSARERLYQQYAHVTIDYYRRTRSDFGVDELLAEVASAVRSHRQPSR